MSLKEQDLLKYSLAELREINAFKLELELLGESVGNSIDRIETEGLMGYFKGPYGFFLHVHYPTRDSQLNTHYKIYFKPKNASNNTDHSIVTSRGETVKIIERWAANVREFSNEIRTFSDPFYEQAEKEIQDIFQFVKEDGDDSTAFSVESQSRIRALLSQLEEEIKLEPKSENTDLILERSKELKDSVHTLPKSVVKSKLTKIMVFLKKMCTKVFNKVIDELIKRGSGWGIDQAQKHIENYIN